MCAASASVHASLGHALNDAMVHASEILKHIKDGVDDVHSGEQTCSLSTDHSDDMRAAVIKHMRSGDEAPCSAFRRAVYWHWANLEYGCSANLEQVRFHTNASMVTSLCVPVRGW